jgi:hypothetical protein
MNEHPIDPFLAAWSDASGSDAFTSRPLVCRALQLPGPWTRARLHAALAAVLVQEPEQRDRFEETFARWFGADEGDQEAEILYLDAWLRAPLAPVGQPADGGEDRVADAECLVGAQQPTAIMSPPRLPGRWWWAALDTTVVLIVVACVLGVGRRPSPKPGTANPRLSRKTVPDTNSVVEGHSQLTEVRRSHAKIRLAATDGEKEREQRDQGDLLTPSKSSMRQRTLTEEHSRDQRATAGSPPDAELSAAQGQRVAVAGPAEPPAGPMSRAQAIEALGKAGIVKKEHRSGLGGLKWFYSRGSVEPEAIPALDSLGGSIGLLFSEESAPKLSPLRSLQRLKGLDLGWTKLSDVSALDGMSLTHLELSGTKVSDVSALKSVLVQDADERFVSAQGDAAHPLVSTQGDAATMAGLEWDKGYRRVRSRILATPADVARQGAGRSSQGLVAGAFRGQDHSLATNTPDSIIQDRAVAARARFTGYLNLGATIRMSDNRSLLLIFM